MSQDPKTHVLKSLTSPDPFPTEERDAIYKAIFSRRDVRGEFLPTPISDEVLSRLLVAAHHAPSVGYMQPWSFIVIRDEAVRRRVHDLFVKAHAEAALMFPEDKRDFYRALKLEGILEAPVNLCITCDRMRAGRAVIGRTHIPIMDLYSSVCAVQNLWLAARAEGIGVGWVSIFDQADLRKVLGIPKGIVPVAYLCLGQVSGFHGKPELEAVGWRPRLPLHELIHLDRWGCQEAEDALSTLARAQQEEAGRNGRLPMERAHR